LRSGFLPIVHTSPQGPTLFTDLENFTRARGLRVRRQQRPVDEVANLSALIEGEWVRGHRERSWGAVSCAAVAKLRGARALEESFKASKLSEAQF
jgi:hypothetical protein